MKKILIVEDEKPLSKVLSNKLIFAGFETRNAFDGREALGILEKEKFDLLILDIVMPKIDGYGVLSKLKIMKIKLPVIVISNLSQEEDIRRVKELGAADYIVKSDISLTEIVERVKKLFNE